MSAVLTDRMTLAEFRELPDDADVDRMLLRGKLVELPMTRRNHWHSRLVAAVSELLRRWKRTLSKPLGEVYAGEVGCDLPSVESGVGIDVAFFGKDVLDAQPENTSYLIGPPLLAVEVLSPSDVIEVIRDKVRDYLAAGVKLVWVIDPDFRTVTVYRPDSKPQMFSEGQELLGDPHLLGLTIRVDELFE